ncbi:hypothetical protein AZA_83226 [Nitrospirillum viridazoti Y2]|nr:hypothetical protein AZA_83226 [Nitrospirillum amazonense Y2]
MSRCSRSNCSRTRALNWARVRRACAGAWSRRARSTAKRRSSAPAWASACRTYSRARTMAAGTPPWRRLPPPSPAASGRSGAGGGFRAGSSTPTAACSRADP